MDSLSSRQDFGWLMESTILDDSYSFNGSTESTIGEEPLNQSTMLDYSGFFNRSDEVSASTSRVADRCLFNTRAEDTSPNFGSRLGEETNPLTESTIGDESLNQSVMLDYSGFFNRSEEASASTSRVATHCLSDMEVKDTSRVKNKKRMKELREKVGAHIDDRIRNFVTRYLHPYLTGQYLDPITRQPIQLPKEPMMDLLKIDLEWINVTLKEAEKIALHEYLKRSVLGLYYNLKARCELRLNFEPLDANKVNEVLYSLYVALNRDFPSKKLSIERVKKLFERAFAEANKERRKMDEEIKTRSTEIRYLKINNPLIDRSNALSELKEGELFTTRLERPDEYFGSPRIRFLRGQTDC